MGTNIAGFNIPFDIPTISSTGIGFWVLVVVTGILLIGLVGLGVWFFLLHKKFYIQIRDFENIAGKGFQLTKKDTARVVKVGDGGEELLLLRRRKTYRTAYGQKMGKNEYWFARGSDGYYYNITLGDLDAKMGTLDIEPIDRDMRYMHVAIRKNVQDRYRKQKFMEKYGTLVINGIFLIIMLIGIGILLSQMGDVAESNVEGIKAGERVTERAATMISSLDNICSGGSGIKPVGVTTT